MTHKPHRTERLLTHGRISGPRADALWDRMSSQLPPERAPASTWRWLGALLPLAAVGVFLVVGRIPDGFQERGAAVDTPAFVEATCTRCPVGKDVFLRVAPTERGGFVHVVLVAPSGRSIIAANIEPPDDGAVPLAQKFIPASEDQGPGITIETWRTRAKLDDVDTWLRAPAGTRQTLHLDVVP